MLEVLDDDVKSSPVFRWRIELIEDSGRMIISLPYEVTKPANLKEVKEEKITCGSYISQILILKFDCAVLEKFFH